MRRARLQLAAVLASGLVMLAFGIGSSRMVFEVPSGAPVQSLLDSAPAGSTIHLEAGTHEGPLRLDRRLHLAGSDGTVVTAPSAEAAVTVAADGASVRDLEVRGGTIGVLVRDADGVAVSDLVIRDAVTHGLELVDAHAVVSGVDVAGLQSDHAQGIEIRNSDGRSDSVIKDSVVSGGQEGIVSHVSELIISGNTVSDTTMRAITVTEMSDGWVRDNTVSSAAGVGLYCGDMSRCEFSGNRVDRVVAGYGGRSSAGWGLVVHYHSSASSHGDVLAGEAGAMSTFVHSRVIDRSPLEPGQGTGAVWPAAFAGLLALVVLAAVYLIVRIVIRVPVSPRRTMSEVLSTVLVLAMIVGLAIQSFHMSEHALQLFRVKVDGVPSRGGIVGPIVEAEWIHFFYNSTVWAFMLLVLAARRWGWTPRGSLLMGDRLMGAAILVQGYHVVEHTFKLGQHLATGSKVNPGILGNSFDLVHLHFAINLAVYLAFLGAAVVYLLARSRQRATMEARRTSTATG